MYLAFPYGISPEEQMLYKTIMFIFQLYQMLYLTYLWLPRVSEHPSYRAVIFPHYNAYLFKAGIRKPHFPTSLEIYVQTKDMDFANQIHP